MKEFDGLVNVIRKLRGKRGCPWDRKQTHSSLKPYVVEEAYELIHAIDKKDNAKIMDELGDVLLQVVLHARIAEEKGEFGIRDVINSIRNKMVRRHPHVFAGKKVKGVMQVWSNWEQIKSEEASVRSILDSIPKAMPALYRADKTQKKAARVGFDWDNVAGAWDKVFEELEEIREVIGSKPLKKKRLSEEMGDLLFSIVNVARKMGLNSEETLHNSVEKFSKRFFRIEKHCRAKGALLSELSLDEMEKLWNKAKKPSLGSKKAARRMRSAT